MLRGVDISNNNQHPINWEVVRSQGISFAIIKLTELSTTGSYVNPSKDEDIANAKAAGLDVAGYVFIHPDVPAKDTVNFAKEHSAGVYRIAVDSETLTTWPQVFSTTKQCLDLLAPRSMLYSNLSFLQSMTGAPWGYQLWLAEYGPRSTFPNAIWQYSQTGRVKGIAGNVDLNTTAMSQLQIKSFFSPPA